MVSCRQMLNKLAREIERVETNLDRDDASDHGTNAAWTAWHLADWFWADIRDINKKDGRTIAALAAEFGANPSSFGLDEFKRRVIERCDALRICQIITTASKHALWEKKKDPTSLTATGSARTVIQEGPPGLGIVIHSRWILEVVVDGEKLEAVPLFREAWQYWQRLIERHGVGSTGST